MWLLYNDDGEQCYCYSLCVKAGADGETHVPTHILLVADNDKEYGEYLESKAAEYQYNNRNAHNINKCIEFIV